MHHQYSLKNNSLITRYNILNQCLQLIKQSKIKTVMKLEIETKLIRMKRLLLNEPTVNQLKSGKCGEEKYEGLLLQMRKISGGICNDETLADFLQSMRGILTTLGNDHPSH